MKMEAAANVWGIGNGLGEGVKETPPQILVDQFTLSQPRGAFYAQQIILAPPDFQTFRLP